MISTFFIKRPIIAMVIAIVTVILGVLALSGLPLAQFPQIVPPQINVSTTYTGADAVTIEQSVSSPIEQQVSGVPGMLYMLSTNANAGSENLSVTFDISTRSKPGPGERAGSSVTGFVESAHGREPVWSHDPPIERQSHAADFALFS